MVSAISSFYSHVNYSVTKIYADPIEYLNTFTVT